MRFSERMGFRPPKLMQVDDLDKETRNRIWNVLRSLLEDESDTFSAESLVLKAIRASFFKETIDDIPTYSSLYIDHIKSWFMDSAFFDVFDFIEFLSDRYGNLSKVVNSILEVEKVSFRLIDGKFVKISDEIELNAVAAALELSDRFAGARSHIAAALAAFSKRPTADYPNAVREAISAVESAAKVIAGNDNAVFNVALKTIDKIHGMHPAFKVAVEKLYAYTSDEPGARHARLNETTNIDEADAHFMIVTCAAIVNFLVQRYGG